MDLFDTKRFSKVFLIFLALLSTLALIGCGGDGDGAATTTTTTTGVTGGIYTITANGGEGGVLGGTGGTLQIDDPDVAQILRTGSVNASQTVPPFPTVPSVTGGMGPYPKEITVDADISSDVISNIYNDPGSFNDCFGTGAPCGDWGGASRMYQIRASAPNDNLPATGLLIRSGVTATINLDTVRTNNGGAPVGAVLLLFAGDYGVNDKGGWADPGDGTYDLVPYDIVLEANSTLEILYPGNEGIDAPVIILVRRIIMGEGAKIVAKNAATATTAGADGTPLGIYMGARNATIGGTFPNSLTGYTQAILRTIDVSGNDATSGNGGYGTYLGIYSIYYNPSTNQTRYRNLDLYIAGSTLDTSGGNAAGDGDGGYGGDIYMYIATDQANYNIYNAATINASGGNGAAATAGFDGDGGNAGYVRIWGENTQGATTGEDVIASCGSGCATTVNNYNIQYVWNSGTVTSNGGNGVGIGDGGDGNGMEIYNSPSYFAQIVNTGSTTVTANGGNGVIGGNAGGIYLEEAIKTYNTANLTVNGGNSTGAGANGGGWGEIFIEADGGTATLLELVYNSGTPTATGGNASGADADGGEPSYIMFYVDDYGNIYNEGDIVMRGGNATGTGDSNGAYGGDVYFYIDGEGNIFNNADITANGGDGTNDGGDGGYIEFYIDFGGNINVAGDMSANGGTGTDGDGGDGGDLYFYNDYDGNVTLFNYASMEFNGGDAVPGGDGGNVDIDSLYLTWNEADIFANGGNDATGAGGDGGWIALWSDVKCVNYGALTANGGDGDDNGGFGGLIYCGAYERAENFGALSANGGDASDTLVGMGGMGGETRVWSEGVSTNSGLINANGGYGPAFGGFGGEFYLWSDTALGGVAVNEGDVHCDGGDASLTDGRGGEGGLIDLRIWNSGTGLITGEVDNTGTLTVVGGAGNWPGPIGFIFIDGVEVGWPDGIFP